MAHINIPDEPPGIVGLFAFRPQTAAPLRQLAETLLRGESSLTPGERELIAARVSRLNECKYCCDTHSAYASVQVDGGFDSVDSVLEDAHTDVVTPKLSALLDIAAQVQESGRAVTTETVEAARSVGATDVEIHDAVLIAAAFCMFNRYVDGLGTFAPDDRNIFLGRAQTIAESGYLAASTSALSDDAS